MPIQFKCDCGKSLRVKDELTGKKVRCPGCSEVLAVPPADDEIVPVLTYAPPHLAPPKPKWDDDEQTAVTEKPSGKRPAKSTDDPLDDYDDRPAKSRKRRDDDDDDQDKAPRRRRRYSPDRLHTSHGEMWSGIGAGVGLMVLGVVLFVGPLAFGWFVPYSAILFIAGIFTLIKAAMRK